MAQAHGFEVNWSSLPTPVDDGGADHLIGMALPRLSLPATSGAPVTLADLPGITVLYIYPMTGTPGVALPEGWDQIPGARGCTPQSCAFRDRHAELLAAGALQVFGMSTQTPAAQLEAASRLHLPFALLSDTDERFARALSLPMFETEAGRHHKRLTLIAEQGTIVKTFYPVFPPDADAAEVEAWLRAR